MPDAGFAPAKKRAPKSARPRGNGTKRMLLVDGAGTPLGAYLDAASPAEVKLVDQTLASMPLKRRPARLIADREYDSDGLRGRLERRGIPPIIPALRNHPNATDQDGRCLRRYRRRWIVERTIGWLGNFRRLTVRYDRLMATYGGFFHLACALLVLRRVEVGFHSARLDSIDCRPGVPRARLRLTPAAFIDSQPWGRRQDNSQGGIP